MTDRKLTGGHSSAARRLLAAAALPFLKGQLPFSEEYWPGASLEKMSQYVHFQEHCFQSPGSLPHPRPHMTPHWPGLCVLSVEVGAVQFLDMGVTIPVAPQEVLTGQMKSHFWLCQASPVTEGRLVLISPPGSLLGWPQEH